MRIDAIPIGNNPPEDVNVIIEVPVGGQPIKYEMNKEAGTLFVDRFLYTPMTYPGNYGFVPHTLSGDGDPADVLVIMPMPLIPGSVIRCRAVGMLNMEDEAGDDQKIIAVPVSKVFPAYDGMRSVDDLPDLTKDRIAHFFQHYKDLEPGKWVRLRGWADADAARAEIVSSVERYEQAPEKPNF